MKLENYEKDHLQLNLQLNDENLLECRGWIQGVYPVYLQDTTIYTEKFVEEAHKSTLHSGTQLTMVKVREQHWVLCLRRLVKRIVKGCPGCKQFQATAVAVPPPGLLYHPPFKLWELTTLAQSSLKPLTSVKGRPTLSCTLAV